MSENSTIKHGNQIRAVPDRVAAALKVHDNPSDPHLGSAAHPDPTLRLATFAKNARSIILVVDDDGMALNLIAGALEVHGFSVARASNGLQALEIMQKRPVSVLLTDMRMPHMDGIELTRAVRSRGLANTCIIMLTMRENSIDFERGYAAGVDDYVVKRRPDFEFLARVNAAVEASEVRRSLKEARASLAGIKKSRPALVGGGATETASNGVSVSGRSHASEEDVGATAEVLALRVMETPKILLVDDDEIMMERLKIPMVNAGYEVSTATSGAAALHALQRDFKSIAILDRSMPGVDGLTLCRDIRERSWPGYVYVMLLTARDSEEDVLMGLDAGADDYLSKRVSDAQLIARLSTAGRILALEYSLKGAIEERRQLAMTDALTGAPNRRYFLRYLSGELKRARRFGADLSLLMLDIDFFKQINDRFGHAGGDSVLQQFVKRMQQCLPRDYDWCARLGGEEFAVVLPQTNLAGAAVVAEKLRRAIEEHPMRLNAQTHRITTSIGVSGLEAMADRDGTTAESLLAHADKYLYDSKEAGRNRITLAQPRATR